MKRLIRRKGRCLVILGENSHHGTGTLDYEKDLIKKLREREYNIMGVFLEENEWYNQELETYYKTGEISELLRRYLTEFYLREDVEGGYNHKLKLIETCREFNISVLFIDKIDQEDRDRDWFEKIKDSIGDDVDGLYLLIVGRNHASRSSYSRPYWLRPTIAKLLDQKYPGAVLSILCSTVDMGQIDKTRNYVEKAFASDLVGINKKGTAGIRTKNSPYEGKTAVYGGNVSVDEEFDIVLALPGKFLDGQFP